MHIDVRHELVRDACDAGIGIQKFYKHAKTVLNVV